MAMAAAPGLDCAQLEALYTADPDRLAQLQSIVGFMSQRGQGNLFLSVPTVEGRPLDLVRLLEKVGSTYKNAILKHAFMHYKSTTEHLSCCDL
jgi:hypothetical protein